MPAYHCKQNTEGLEEACSCTLLPIKSDIKGQAPIYNDNGEDIIDEVLTYFRANVLFRNFDVKNGADRTLIYLTLYACQCLVKCEKIDDKPTALRELKELSRKQFAIPGDANWPLGSLYPQPANRNESDLFRAYFKQAREELCIRLVERHLFDQDGTKNKWWQSFSKRKFMGKELKE